ncbi:hypothetical protein D3C85_1117400 [compost metagenome]
MLVHAFRYAGTRLFEYSDTVIYGNDQNKRIDRIFEWLLPKMYITVGLEDAEAIGELTAVWKRIILVQNVRDKRATNSHIGAGSFEDYRERSLSKRGRRAVELGILCKQEILRHQAPFRGNSDNG